MSTPKTYLAIDLKSYYASAECVDRHLDPLTTNLVVADFSRTEKTICLAVSPSLKAQGIPGRPRLFEVVQLVREINARRLMAYRRQTHNPTAQFSSASFNAEALAADSSLELAYITAPPRMARYMDLSTQIYSIYLRYVSSEDIIAYSIDEVFIDISGYLSTYHLSARDLAMTMIREVLYATGITATVGIGTNLYLAKIAMDIVAKHVPADRDGVRIAELDEMAYRRILWGHRPLTDFWRLGPGIARKLEAHNIHTMGELARCSLGRDPLSGAPSAYYTEDFLYKLFGINAELLIDHAWGYEPATIDVIKAYTPENNSLSSGQVLHMPYKAEKARIVTREMADALSLDLVRKGLTTDQIVLAIGYDRESVTSDFNGKVVCDHYGRYIPKPVNASLNLDFSTASTKMIVEAAMTLFDRIVDDALLIRRINIAALHVVSEQRARETRQAQAEQLDLFTDYDRLEAERAALRDGLARERRLQEAAVSIHRKFGKNALLKATSLEDGATMRDRNQQVGGHKA